MSVWWLIPLAVSVVYLSQFIIRFMQSRSSGSGKSAISPEEYRTFKLVGKVNTHSLCSTQSCHRHRAASVQGQLTQLVLSLSSCLFLSLSTDQ